MDYKNALCVGRRASSTRDTLCGKLNLLITDKALRAESSCSNSGSFFHCPQSAACWKHASLRKAHVMDKTQNLTKSLFQNRIFPEIFMQKISGTPFFGKNMDICEKKYDFSRLST